MIPLQNEGTGGGRAGEALRSVHLESVDRASTNVENTKSCGDGAVPANLPKVLNHNAEESNVKYRALSNMKESPRHHVAVVFTCKVCETRSVKTICQASYEKCVVVARCGRGCNNLHLIADQLGWFGEPGRRNSWQHEEKR